MTSADTHRTIDAVWRIESPRIIAGIARIVRDLGVAEELAQDALVAALEQWPTSGIPDNPGAWLTAAAKNRAIDHFRRNKRLEQKHQELKYQQESQQNVPDYGVPGAAWTASPSSRATRARASGSSARSSPGS